MFPEESASLRRVDRIHQKMSVVLLEVNQSLFPESSAGVSTNVLVDAAFLPSDELVRWSMQDQQSSTKRTHEVSGSRRTPANSQSLSKRKHKTMLKNLWNDEAGVILSAELVLISTILVLGMIVGLVELQCSIVAELSDLSSAFGNLNQSYNLSGFASSKGNNQFKARTYGAAYTDRADTCDCDANLSIVCTDRGESQK